MNIRLAYRGHSGVADGGASQTLSLAPNLAREPVAFDAPLLRPVRFREAISALHDIVISDLRFKKRDKAGYQEWKKRQSQQDAAVRRQAFAAAKEKILAARETPVAKDLQRTYRAHRTRYWKARQEYANYLYKHDVEMWRLLMPCDPVITVAEDVCFFECFSGDESSYGCLTVDREGAFGKAERVQFGTTNVDYSWDLYHHFQALRSYRDTRFKVDPEGFEVATGGTGDLREEKIDLPRSWLRGFMQIQAAMVMPATRVSLSREAVYSLLAWLKRHKPRTSPRAMRFELVPGRSPRVVMEPWEVPVESYATRYEGPATEAIRIWGTRRLVVLGRLLPLADAFDVYLLGTGLPSFWVARMGDMRLTLGLSGWTANDWTRSSALDMLAPPAYPTREQVDWMANVLREKRAATFRELVEISFGGDPATTSAALRYLAYAGQLIYDLHAGVYRWRQIMPQAVGEAEIGPEHEEMTGLRELLRYRRPKDRVKTREQVPGVGLVITGEAGGNDVEVLIDADGRIRRGKCQCTHYRRFGIRNGPCRHMMAMRYLN